MGITITAISLIIITRWLTLAAFFDSWQNILGSVVGGVGGALIFIFGVVNPVQRFLKWRAEQRKAQAETVKAQTQTTLAEQQIREVEGRLNDRITQLDVMVRQLGVASSNLLVQQRRLAEHNLSVEATARLAYRFKDLARTESSAHPESVSEGFIVMELSLTNIGDSPVDILACMAAGRELTNAYEDGVYLGAAGRDVRWRELPSYYWWNPAEIASQGKAEPPGQQLFRGLSTTKNLPYSRWQLIRLDPGEGEILTRIDYVTDLERFYRQGHVNLIYKLFTVTLGYPLAEISRQIGAGPTGPTTPAESARLYTQELARPNYRRWARVQRALFLINRFSFRLALQGREAAEGQPGKYYSDDPLGRLTEANAWRCFLLHHWDFIEYGNAKPGDAPDPVGDLRRKAEEDGVPLITTDTAKEYINENFQVSERTLENYDVAREYLRDHLQHLIDAWKRLNDTIERCYQPGFSFDDLLKTEPEYRARWEALKEEGYLLTKPSWEAAPTGMNDSDAIERFTTRAKYVMVTVQAPGIHPAQRMG